MDYKEATKELQKINRGLFVEPKHGDFGAYYCIKHKDDRTGLIRDVYNVLDQDGRPRALHLPEIRSIARSVDWDMVGKYQEPEALANAYIEEFNYRKRRAELERKGFILDYNKDNRHNWKLALEDFIRNLTPEEVKMLKREKARKEYAKEIRTQGRIFFDGGKK